MLFLRNNDFGHMSAEILNTRDEQTEINVASVLYKPSAKMHFPVYFEFMFDILQNRPSR
jgi:hypothetical protein